MTCPFMPSQHGPVVPHVLTFTARRFRWLRWPRSSSTYKSETTCFAAQSVADELRARGAVVVVECGRRSRVAP